MAAPRVAGSGGGGCPLTRQAVAEKDVDEAHVSKALCMYITFALTRSLDVLAVSDSSEHMKPLTVWAKVRKHVQSWLAGVHNVSLGGMPMQAESDGESDGDGRPKADIHWFLLGGGSRSESEPLVSPETFVLMVGRSPPPIRSSAGSVCGLDLSSPFRVRVVGLVGPRHRLALATMPHLAHTAGVLCGLSLRGLSLARRSQANGTHSQGIPRSIPNRSQFGLGSPPLPWSRSVGGLDHRLLDMYQGQRLAAPR